MNSVHSNIVEGNLSLGIEFGSTRIKAILIDDTKKPIASGSYEWENQLIDGVWTYSLEAIKQGLQSAYANLKENVMAKYQLPLTKISRIGISAMMHGYMAFDQNDDLLVPFRTWRNTFTGDAARELSELFHFNIPERWSIAHLYHAILSSESHVNRIAYLTTLSGYIHWQLTGEKVIGIGDASGMFPIDSATGSYSKKYLEKFSEKIQNKNFSWNLEDILPRVLSAGVEAGQLSFNGAKFLDPTGQLAPGARFCPPEGDAGTGMVATNSIKKRTGNISAGTSIFAMIVLEEALKTSHSEIDIVTTPVGDQVAMVHANNCSSELNAWVSLFKEFSLLTGHQVKDADIYSVLFKAALQGEKDCGGILTYGYYSGESITSLEEGRPLLVRTPDSHFTIPNLMRSHILSAFSTLAIGMEILIHHENIQIDSIMGHGGIFTTPQVAQSLLAAAIDTPVTIMENAGEGGAWGMALLADYLNYPGQTLESYLDNVVFSDVAVQTLQPDLSDVAGFKTYLESYKAGLAIEKVAVENF